MTINHQKTSAKISVKKCHKNKKADYTEVQE